MMAAADVDGAAAEVRRDPLPPRGVPEAAQPDAVREGRRRPTWPALPKGTTCGPAPSNVEPWVTMDYGPSLMNTYEVGGPGPNIAYKGIAVRLDAGAGRRVARQALGAVRPRHAAARGGLDRRRLHRLERASTSTAGTRSTRSSPARSTFANPVGPGWADPETGRFDDPRLDGPRRPALRPAAADVGAVTAALYHFGDQTILSYTVGDAAVLELAGAESRPEAAGGGRLHPDAGGRQVVAATCSPASPPTGGGRGCRR